MMTNVINQIAYLRTSRNFPQEIPVLVEEISKTYIDIANAVNNRTISLFPTNRPAITGESWFVNQNQRQQSLRQVYNITSYAAFNHGIDFNSVYFFSVIRGIGYDGTNYFPIPYVSANATADQVGIFVTPTQVVFSTGGGSPVLTKGIIILEWITQK